MKKNIMFLILIVLMSAFSVNCSKENIESITDVGPLAVCGNNIIEENEGCDDGNTITESCLYGETSCTVCDSTCSSVAGVLTGYCGDSITNGPEGCDDGNTITESCLYGETSCTVCDSTCSSVAGVLTGYCGDSITNGPEGCDDGNTITGDGCDLCVVETATPVCGNTITESGETCDDGNTITESCLYGETSCTVCDSTCNSVAGAVTGYCGDGAINGGETCDDSNTVTESCVYGETSCTVCDATCNSVAGAVTGFCGDGAINGGETCDDSNTVTESCVYGETSCTVCDATCSSVAGALTGYCGDSITNGPEGCDDGNTITGDGCDLCVVETATPVCGNSITESGETCDDGNTITESCLYGETSCTVCDATCNSVAGALTGYCGDGATNGSEECDDANVSDNDACLNNCTAATCGDGFIQAGVEECDDADLDNTDICLDTCQLATCGDSFVQLGVEACDDGNALNTDACLNTCEAASCGDGFIESGVETCDDANTVTESCVYGETSCTVCDATCNSVAGTVTGYCGDGAINGGETCDDSNTVTESCVYGETSCTVCDATCSSVAGALTGYCGDSITNGPEDCDDGNTITGDGCDLCVVETATPVCGNSITESGETCDDGNTITESCLYGETSCTVCDATCNSVAGALTGYCGDGATNGSEECDDANASDNDACLNNCTAATCGDGFIQAGFEECDDADLDNTDICLDTCQLATCGDSFVQLGVEACDDGNALNTDACLNTCEAASCGDGFIESGVETCDDANTVTESCVYGETSCTVCDSTCNSVAGAVTGYCGDGAINGGETCDDSNTVTESCVYGETSCTVCDATCNSVAGAVTGYCGDGAINGGETCDDSNTVTESCVYGETSCTVCDATCNSVAGALTGYCGDGATNGPEECDDANASDNDACLNNCTAATCGDGFIQAGVEECDDADLDNTDICLDTCQLATCGDSFVQLGVEACDDGNALNTDACLNTCEAASCGDGFIESGVETCDDANTVTESCVYGETSCTVCDSTCNSVAGAVTGYCGDGAINGGETCDDSNTVTESCVYGEISCTVCDATCNSVAGALTGYCGDGATNGPEECDDANASDNDACLNNCTAATCGDGFIQAGVEECDDADLDNTDICLDTCQLATCGDSFVQLGVEACDDGNALNTDACLNTCEAASCGDGFIESGVETCDDANTVTESCVYGETSCTVCDATCNSVAGAVTGYCGDGAINGGETCDDSNTVTESCAYGETSCTVCDATCNSVAGTTTYCGDSITDGANGETCDENAVQSGTCEANCQNPICGDGIVNAFISETCDDGNTTAGDKCSSTCTVEPEGSVATPITLVYGVDLPHSAQVSGSSPNSYYKITGLSASIEYIALNTDATGDSDLYVYSDAAFLTQLCSDFGTIISDKNCLFTAPATGIVYIKTDSDSLVDLFHTLNVVEHLCGDNMVYGTEVCDDGNTTSGDGCNATCSTITTTEADIYEVDDTPAGASAITPNSTQFHTIHTAGNVDYISLNITDTTKTYLFKTSDGAGSCDMDTVIYLYDTDGTTLLTFDDQSGMGNCSAFAYQFTSSGTYFIKVEDYLSGTGSYVLEAYDYVPENQAPIADTWDSDTSGVVGNPVLLDGNWSLDSDWSNCGSSGTLNYLWEIASAPGGSTATIAGNTLMTTSFTPDMAGTYEIQLTVTDDSGYCSGGNKSDTVSLFIDAIIWPPTTIGTIIVDGGYQTVTVNSIVYVEFSVAAGNTYTINWDDDYDGSGTYSGGGDIYASAYNPNGSAIFTNIDSGYPNGFDGEGQTFTATQAGTVYIKLNPAFAIGDVGIQVTDVTPPPSIYSDNFNDLDITDWAVTDIAGNGVVWNVVSDYWGDTLNGSPFIFIDSDAGGTVNVDSTVESPAIDTTAAATLFLEFDQYFEAASGAEILDVDVWDGTAWQNVYTYTGVSLGLWGFSDQQSIDISTHSNAGLKVRFHYYNANWDFYWAVDNVVIRE